MYITCLVPFNGLSWLVSRCIINLWYEGARKRLLFCAAPHMLWGRTQTSVLLFLRFSCGLLPSNTFWRITHSPASAVFHQLMSFRLTSTIFFPTSNHDGSWRACYCHCQCQEGLIPLGTSFFSVSVEASVSTLCVDWRKLSGGVYLCGSFSAISPWC